MRDLLLVSGIALIAADSSGAEVPSLNACTNAQCVDELAIKYCFERNAAQDDCRSFLQALNDSPRAKEREFRLALAAASRALADRTSDDQERVNLRKLGQEAYRKLIAENPNDAQALIGLAGATEDRAERVALLRKAVEVVPENTIALRALNAMLMNGTRTEQEEAIALLKSAYSRASPQHRWYLAYQLHEQLLALNKKAEAAQFRRLVVTDMRIDESLAELTPAALKGDTFDEDKALKALANVCRDAAIEITGPHDCVNAISSITEAVSAAKKSLTRKSIDAVAVAARSSHVVAHKQSDVGAQSKVRQSLAVLRENKQESPLSLEVEAHVLSATGKADDATQAGKLLEAAIKLDPKSGSARLSLGRFYLDNERPAEAIPHLEQAVQLLPQQVRDAARMNLVLALRRDGKEDRADAVQAQIGTGK